MPGVAKNQSNAGQRGGLNRGEFDSYETFADICEYLVATTRRLALAS